MQKGRRWWFLGKTESLQQLRGLGVPPRAREERQIAGSEWVIRLGDAKKVRSLRTQALGWTCVHFRNGQEDKAGVGGNRRRGEAEGVAGVDSCDTGDLQCAHRKGTQAVDRKWTTPGPGGETKPRRRDF